MRNATNKKLPLSGSEPTYTQRLWGRAVGIGNNNCYAYAVGDYEGFRRSKSIPGERAGIRNGHTYTHCRDCLLYTSPSPRDQRGSRMPSSA